MIHADLGKWHDYSFYLDASHGRHRHGEQTEIRLINISLTVIEVGVMIVYSVL
jgi:hypothetical protein